MSGTGSNSELYLLQGVDPEPQLDMLPPDILQHVHFGTQGRTLLR